MKTLGIVLLGGLLSIWTELPPACGQKLGDLWVCPQSQSISILPQQNRCKKDSDCPGVQLCCQVLCGKRCVLPVKRGFCPMDTCTCTRPQPDECIRDFSCPGMQKCCYKCCAALCMDPMQE